MGCRYRVSSRPWWVLVTHIGVTAMTASPCHRATDGHWISSQCNAASKSLTLAAGFLIAALGQGKCFADVVLTSVNLSGTVTVGPDAYRSAQTVTGSAGTGLQGLYDGYYGRQVNEASSDTGWSFDWIYGPDEFPWGPAGSSQLIVQLKSVYELVDGGSLVVKEELSGSLRIDLTNTVAGGYSGPLSFPEATPDRSNVRKAVFAQVTAQGLADRAADVGASITFSLQSDVPLLRVFMTDDNDALVYDSGPLGGVMSSPIMSQTWTYDSLVGIDVDNRYVYTITAVPEPSTYAMALVGLACGSYLVRRRGRVLTCERPPSTSPA